MQNNGDPAQALTQLMGNASVDDRQELLKQGKKYGAPDEVLSKFQNLK